jgi:hypothetical protein
MLYGLFRAAGMEDRAALLRLSDLYEESGADMSLTAIEKVLTPEFKAEAIRVNAGTVVVKMKPR